MTPDEVTKLVEAILREKFGNYLTTDAKIIIPKTIQILSPNGFDGSLGISGGSTGVYGNSTSQAAAISAPSTPSAGYVQAEAQSAVNAINSIRSALSNFGITS